ncbi:MAG: ABC transporter permease [Candidatus Hadarchaeum sp.]|uniref:ABC transporter permease n=1 Tax=Candidatus Hadarchaeum sp. TaxID=2883567 RepID=UPI0031766F21
MIDVISSVLSYFPVIGLAALGGLIGQKAGVYNIAVGGIMMAGAVGGLFGYFVSGSLWVGLLVGFLWGVFFGVLLSLLTVNWRLNQIVIGFTLWFLAEGLGKFLYPILLPGSFKVPERFGYLFGFDHVFYLTIALFIAVFVIFKWTRQGLAIHVAGESPDVGDIAGINIFRVRWICNIIGAGLMGMAGAYLADHVLQGYNYTMIAGYGWVAFAIVLFGRFSPTGVLLGSLFFSSLIGIQTRLQVAGALFLPSEFMVVIPHIGVVLVLAIIGILGKKSGIPSALGVPYKRE